jgi:hypothetical protein
MFINFILLTKLNWNRLFIRREDPTDTYVQRMYTDFTVKGDKVIGKTSIEEIHPSQQLLQRVQGVHDSCLRRNQAADFDFL